VISARHPQGGGAKKGGSAGEIFPPKVGEGLLGPFMDEWYYLAHLVPRLILFLVYGKSVNDPLTL